MSCPGLFWFPGNSYRFNCIEQSKSSSNKPDNSINLQFRFMNHKSRRISQLESEQLEFDKILDRVTSLCKGALGKEYILHQQLDTHHSILVELQRTRDIVEMINESELFDFLHYEDISEDLKMLEKTGYVLESESILRILTVCTNYDHFINSFSAEKKSKYANVYELGKIEDYSDTPIQKILKVFAVTGELRPDASPEMVRINKKIEGLRRQIDRTFDDLIGQFKKKQLLAENLESIRNGRRVLVLPVENKRKMQGVIHDQSASGKTVYMEPQVVMSLNNDLYSLQNDLRAETYRVLRELSNELREDRYLIDACLHKIIRIDACRAKGMFSHHLEGVLPEISERPLLHIQKGKHPLLLLQELEGGQKTIDFDLELKGNNRLVLISGPNAGGKSVTLKAVGLIHMMVYRGILVPVGAESTIGIFSRIFCDIGDQQSIDEGLSTYSSHLQNLRQILDQVDDRTLVLLDEIGSGTDPKLGGAIAEGIIKGLLAKSCYGIITTHYSELKVFAFKNKGIINGAMLFDKEHLRPTYKLKVGKPGSSYAFEVAKKVGLDPNVIKYARRKVGKKENQIEDLLIDLQEGKAILDEQLDYIEKEKDRLDKLIRNYQRLSDEFQVKRKKLQIRAKEIEFKKANEESMELQSLISKLEKERNLEKAIEKKKRALEKRKLESQEIVTLKKDILAQRDVNEKISIGDYVKMIDGELSGEVLSIKGDKAKVLFGLMQMEVALEDLTLANAQIEFNGQKGINVKGVAFEANFSPKIDIRGYKMDDAEITLDEFFDKALLNNARLLEIVHGKGKGALRKLVISKIKQFKDFQSYYHPSDEQGGDGVTMVRL